MPFKELEDEYILFSCTSSLQLYSTIEVLVTCIKLYFVRHTEAIIDNIFNADLACRFCPP